MQSNANFPHARYMLINAIVLILFERLVTK